MNDNIGLAKYLISLGKPRPPHPKIQLQLEYTHEETLLWNNPVLFFGG